MARAAAIACTLAVCIVICVGQQYEDVTQDDLNLQQTSVFSESEAIQTLNTGASQPVIRVTVWSTSGFIPQNTFEVLSSMAADPFGWLSNRLGENAVAVQPSMDQVLDVDLDEMLRRVSCARMRQAMMEYYNARQTMGRTQIRLTPFIMTSTGPVENADDDRFESASTASLFDFPLRGTSIIDEEQRDESTETADPGLLRFSQTAAEFNDALSRRAVEPSSSQTDTLTTAGLQHLTSMLHTVSGLLQPGSTASASSQTASSFDGTSQEWPEPIVTASSVEQYDDSYNAKEAGMQTAISEPEYYKASEPFSQVDQSADTWGRGSAADFGAGQYTDPREALSSSTYQTQDGWVDGLPAYYSDGEYDDEDSSYTDWGLVIFTLLSALCVVVWAVVVTQYVRLRALWVHPHFEYDSDSVLVPLLEKLHAVEVAANHVDPTAQSIDTKAALLKAEYCPRV